MNICLLSTAVPAHRSGGIENHCWNLAGKAAALGHKVHLVTTAHPAGLELEKKDGISVHYLAGTNPAMSRKWAKAWWTRSAAKIRELHNAEGLTVIWAEGAAGQYYAAQVRSSLGVPLITIAPGMGLRGEILSAWKDTNSAAGIFHFFTFYAGQMLFSYLPWSYRAMKYSDRVAAVSEETAVEIKKEFGLPPEKVKVILNGVDTTLFRPDPAGGAALRARLGIDAQEKVVLMSGTANRQKGFHLGLEAFDLSNAGRKARLILAGDGPELPALKRAAAGLGISSRIIFAGNVPNREMPGFYNAADIYLNPTLRAEGLPLVLVEAMACGKPSVVSLAGGTGSTIREGESGFFVRPGDVAGMAGRIDALLSGPELTARFSANARARAVEKFSLEAMTKSYLELSLEIQREGGLRQ